ncbi:DEAD/DEAH box helicase [Pedobacter sp. UBA4863]|mgnify:CR=1 FL=1|uniref:DEAD/DEAH box helicase n=1 Tax=Pedobacter sp. UBA4863 TaxID=1947060 RepID=UPI0025D54ACD|nr:DEAD/DEAH box helicase [Pedobacter sp. UBA4863]
MSTPNEILRRLFQFELWANAQRLNLIDTSKPTVLDIDLLTEAISILNDLSVNPTELHKRQIVAISALIWTYRDLSWDGLKNYLILFLSRAGFAPSSIMVDDNYQDNKYSSSVSLINQFAIAIEQAVSEIKIGEKGFLVSEFQKEIWDSIDNNNIVGISAPTSAGKSFIILLKAIDLIIKKEGQVIYIVPTLSLVSQVMMDFRKTLDDFHLDYSIESTFNIATTNSRSIYVLTQEKAIAAFSQSDIPFSEVRIVVIDEIQNVEKVAEADDQRSKVLYDLIVEFRNSSNIDHVVISGPKIVKIDELGKALFGSAAKKNETDASPVLNLTYSISKIKTKYYFNVYSDLLDSVEKVQITNTEKIQGYGKVRYDEVFLGYVKSLMQSFKNDECSLIFSPTSNQCSKIAFAVGEDENIVNGEFLNGLSDFISTTVHPQFPLANTIKKGVAYHHGKLPFHARILIEDAIRKKKIRTIVSTTTLLQGVNLPVQNIIIRNPNLFVQSGEGKVKLSNYEIANLRGRAGRLLKDFVGRTFILDEQSFQDDKTEQLDIFKNTSKELSVGYGSRYTEHYKMISHDLQNNIGTTPYNQEYSYLTTYLRQTVLRYGQNSPKFLEKVGIKLSDQELEVIVASMNNLAVPREVCSRNRYWDPIDLDKLNSLKINYSLPTSASENNIANKLKAILLLLKQDFSVYYSRYFGIENAFDKNGREIDHIMRMCILTDKWLKEKSLFELFSDPYYDTATKVESTISDLQNKVSYGLPLLLKPIYDISEPEAMFTRFIELGAFLPITRKFIELNIPRETAIYLNEKYVFNNVDDKHSLLRQLRAIKSQLSYWHQVQLGSI